MSDNSHILIVFPVFQSFLHKCRRRPTLPVSIGTSMRTKDGAFIENIMILGDKLPLEVSKSLLAAPHFFGEDFTFEDVFIRLFTNLSKDAMIPVDFDWNGDPLLEIREFAEVHVEMPSQMPEELTVQITIRCDEKGLSASAKREDTGEPLPTEIRKK